jgi:hypothetical protein
LPAFTVTPSVVMDPMVAPMVDAATTVFKAVKLPPMFT